MKKPIRTLILLLSITPAFVHSNLSATAIQIDESEPSTGGYLDPDTKQLTDIISFSTTRKADGGACALTTSFVKDDAVLHFVQEQIQILADQKIFVGEDSWTICETSGSENDTICKIKFAPKDTFSLANPSSNFAGEALQCASFFAGLGAQDPLQSICEPDGILMLTQE